MHEYEVLIKSSYNCRPDFYVGRIKRSGSGGVGVIAVMFSTPSTVAGSALLEPAYESTCVAYSTRYVSKYLFVSSYKCFDVLAQLLPYFRLFTIRTQVH